MYPLSPTETEEFIKMIEEGSPKITDTIQEYIENHTFEVSEMQKGVDYYSNKTDITKRKIMIYDESNQEVEDRDATNNKLASGWHKNLVDQKVSYLAGEPVTLGSKTEKDISLVTETIGDEFEDTLPELIKGAANKGREWLHPYIDEEGNFDHILIPAQEGIPIYDNSKRKNLDAFIRYYYLDDETMKIELWDKEKVTYYERTKNGEIVLDSSVEVNPSGHWEYGTEEGGYNRYGWGKVPFIEFPNNEERVSDLTFYKSYIDAFDLLMSDVTNTLEDMQSIIFAIKGYEGQDAKGLLKNIKRYKNILLSDEPGSGVDVIRADVPVEATKSHYEKLVEGLYRDGQGVRFDTDKFGQSPSGVALQFLYTALDLKASISERKLTKSLKRFIWFVCEYLSLSSKGEFDSEDITVTFNKTMITNESELLENLSKSNASTETKLENDPFVKDVEQEKKRLQDEQDEYMKNMEDIGGGEDE